jgi:hypothetical protein
MLASVRRKVTRAEGVQAFHRSNPSTHPALLVLMGILDGHVIRAKALIQLGSERHQGAKVGVEQRGKLRRRLRIGVLRLFSRVGLAAAKESPSLEGAFRPIRPRVSHLDFAAAGRSMLEAARANVDALGAYGLTPALVEEGATLLDEYVVVADAALAARSERIKANAELRKVAGEIMGVIARIDSLNQHQFADSPAVLAAWKSALDVAGPISRRNGKAATGTDGSTSNPTPPSPASGDVQTAV